MRRPAVPGSSCRRRSGAARSGDRTHRSLEGNQNLLPAADAGDSCPDGDDLSHRLVTDGERPGKQTRGRHGQVKIAAGHGKWLHHHRGRIGERRLRDLDPFQAPRFDEHHLPHALTSLSEDHGHRCWARPPRQSTPASPVIAPPNGCAASGQSLSYFSASCASSTFRCAGLAMHAALRSLPPQPRRTPWANDCAMDSPMPREAPVTSAVRSFRLEHGTGFSSGSASAQQAAGNKMWPCSGGQCPWRTSW